ncbi:sulfate transporter 4.1 [Biscogniauxia sp. FL1348]|nr:sulfate transporter 4.1 [Biscogniauxia sp. FL1348]
MLPAVEKRFEEVKMELRTDTTLNRAAYYARTTPKKLPSATRQYLLDKLPIIEWLPRYSPSWLAQDFMAGLTVGVMLIPQGLSYAKIATIPIEHGLYSSWVPAAVAVFMGTSKDLSTGPTSILGLLTAEIIAGLGGAYEAAEVAAAVSLMVGVYSLLIGVLGLGFLLDYVSIPVLTGFISATALIIGMGQVGSLVGLDGVPDGVFNQIGDVLRRLPRWDGPTCGVGLGSILLLLALEKVGKAWGRRHFAIRYVGSSRAIIVLVVFTLISYLVNRGRGDDDLVWEISKVDTNGIGTPRAPGPALLSSVAGRAIAPLIACTLEHLAVGKAFGRRNHYAIDQTQEFNYLGVTNIVNSFFGSMPVGGAMSRTAVNSDCHVRSPLNGLVTAGFIILTLYVFSPALYWLPKSTLAAIIIMAVIHLFGPLSLIWRYWRISLADFIACMVSFWITIFVSAEIGIGIGAAWSIVWTLLRSAFVTPAVSGGAGGSNNTSTTAAPPQPIEGKSLTPTTPAPAPHHDHSNIITTITPTSSSTVTATSGSGGGGGGGNPSARAGGTLSLPPDTVVLHFQDSIFFPNAHRTKDFSLESLQLVFAPTSTSSSTSPTSTTSTPSSERSWSVSALRRLSRLRRQRGLPALPTARLGVLVWDFSRVPFIDVTGVTALAELRDDVRRELSPPSAATAAAAAAASHPVRIRIVGMCPRVRERFERAGWVLADVDGGSGDYDYDSGQVVLGDGGASPDLVYPSLERAVWDDRGREDERQRERERESLKGVTSEKD